MKKLITPPEALLTNVPVSFFEDNNNQWSPAMPLAKRMILFRDWYVQQTDSDLPIFYHFISGKPKQDVPVVFICWGGRVQVKCAIVDILVNQPLILPTYQHLQPRNWLVTGGPVIAAPDIIAQPGFRGFRYTKMLF
jgi:hypothetical protein